MAESLSFLWAGKEVEKEMRWGRGRAGHGTGWRPGIAAEGTERDSFLRTCMRTPEQHEPIVEIRYQESIERLIFLVLQLSELI